MTDVGNRPPTRAELIIALLQEGDMTLEEILAMMERNVEEGRPFWMWGDRDPDDFDVYGRPS